MIELGKINNLRIVKEVDFGLYLDGSEAGEILLPLRYVPQTYKIDDSLDVFIYKDSEDRIIATTEIPYAMCGDFALLKAKAVDKYGAFMEWGLMKDLMVPFSEQQVRMESGKSYIVKVFIDETTQRLVGSSRIEKFLDKTIPEYSENQEVNILIANRTELGYKIIINNCHTGIIYKNEVFNTPDRGQKMKAYIKKVRDDNKIDVSLTKPGFEKIDSLTDVIMQKLKENNGFLPYNDKSDSEVIYYMFNASKKTFKKAIGALYKQKKIRIENTGIRIA